MNGYNDLVAAEAEYRRLNPTPERVYCPAKKPLLFHPLIRSAGERVVVEKPKPSKPKRYFSPEERKILLPWKKEWLKYCTIKVDWRCRKPIPALYVPT